MVNVLFLRSLIFTTIMMLAVAVWVIPGVLFLFPFSFTAKQRYYRGWSIFVVCLLRKTCHLTFEVSGKDHLPKGAAIVLSKHQSTWETTAFQVISPFRVGGKKGTAENAVRGIGLATNGGHYH
jgi:1-acyl-sn-glycerol-3-phosphate acyltransferase